VGTDKGIQSTDFIFEVPALMLKGIIFVLILIILFALLENYYEVLLLLINFDFSFQLRLEIFDGKYAFLDEIICFEAA
jgi:hypothetical protein